MSLLLHLDDILKPIANDIDVLNKDILSVVSSKNNFLDKIIMHIASSSGKRLRPVMVYLVSRALLSGELMQKHHSLAVSIELLHTATLVHDDIIDNSDKRRNKPTINKIWDKKTAVIAGDYLLSKSLIKLSEVENIEIIKIFANVMNDICEGEIQQHLQSDEIIGLNEYIEKTKRKTALLFALSAKSSAIVCDVDEVKIKKAEDFGLNFGIMFQIIDDSLNFEEHDDKPFLNDLKNGIITAPTIYAIEENPEIEINLQKTNKTDADYEKIYELILKTNGIKKAKQLASMYAQKANENLNFFEDNVYKNSLKTLVNFSLNRVV